MSFNFIFRSETTRQLKHNTEDIYLSCKHALLCLVNPPLKYISIFICLLSKIDVISQTYRFSEYLSQEMFHCIQRTQKTLHVIYVQRSYIGFFVIFPVISCCISYKLEIHCKYKYIHSILYI
jgi:hypothetical protein